MKTRAIEPYVHLHNDATFSCTIATLSTHANLEVQMIFITCGSEGLRVQHYSCMTYSSMFTTTSV